MQCFSTANTCGNLNNSLFMFFFCTPIGKAFHQLHLLIASFIENVYRFTRNKPNCAFDIEYFKCHKHFSVIIELSNYICANRETIKLEQLFYILISLCTKVTMRQCIKLMTVYNRFCIYNCVLVRYVYMFEMTIS